MALSSSLIGKLKVQLKLAINRLRMVQQKDIAIAKQQRREMAHLLEQSREASALIRTENIIRSDIITELHELLELYCELLLARSGLLEQTPCDAGLEEAVRSIIYAAPRTEIKELQMARALLCEKFGKEFATDAQEGHGVSDRVLDKLKVEPPKQELVRLYLGEIARTYGVAWPREVAPKEEAGADDVEVEDAKDGDDDEGDGGAKERSAAAGKSRAVEDPLLADVASPPKGTTVDEGQKPPVRIAPASPSTENPSPRLKLPGQNADERKGSPATPTKASTSRLPPAAPSNPPVAAGKKPAADGVKRVEGKIPDVDELARRFADLKR